MYDVKPALAFTLILCLWARCKRGCPACPRQSYLSLGAASAIITGLKRSGPLSSFLFLFAALAFVADFGHLYGARRSGLATGHRRRGPLEASSAFWWVRSSASGSLFVSHIGAPSQAFSSASTKARTAWRS